MKELIEIFEKETGKVYYEEYADYITWIEQKLEEHLEIDSDEEIITKFAVWFNKKQKTDVDVIGYTDIMLYLKPKKECSKHIFIHIEGKKGLNPSVQDLEYWQNSGYKFITHETDDAITLSKKDVKTEFHAAFPYDLPKPLFKKKEIKPEDKEEVKECGCLTFKFNSQNSKWEEETCDKCN